MKKLFTLFTVCITSISAYAQLVPGGDMENWHTYMSDTATLMAPNGWTASDSLIYAVAPSLPPFIAITPKKQIFQSTNSHNGTYAAELVSRNISSVPGVVPALITNGNVSADLLNFSYTTSGGTPVSLRMTHVNAYTQYTTPGTDTGVLTVQAIKYINGHDSIVGTGSANILPSAAYVQVTAAINYVNLTVVPDTLLISFASSKVQSNTVDSSILYVDDVSIDTVGLAIHQVLSASAITLFPNPTTGIVHINAPQYAGLTCNVYNAAGAGVLQKFVSGSQSLNMSNLASGLYFYTITDTNGIMIQNGRITLNK